MEIINTEDKEILLLSKPFHCSLVKICCSGLCPSYHPPPSPRRLQTSTASKCSNQICSHFVSPSMNLIIWGMLQPTGTATTSTTPITSHHQSSIAMQVRSVECLFWLKLKKIINFLTRPVHPTGVGSNAEVWVRQSTQLQWEGINKKHPGSLQSLSFPQSPQFTIFTLFSQILVRLTSSTHIGDYPVPTSTDGHVVQVVVVAYYWPRGNRPDQVIPSEQKKWYPHLFFSSTPK